MLASSNIISKRLNNLQFGYYDPEEIRKLSVKEIKNAKAFDQLNNPIKGGLYDPALGVQPHDRGTRCVTCGQEFFECTGHIGHIELLLPVYNPFLVNKLLALLRSKCFFCHHLRITKERKKYYKIKFKLLKLGLLIEMREFENLSLQKKKVVRFLGSKLNEASRKGSGDTTTKALSEKSQDRIVQKQEKQPDQLTQKQAEQQYNDNMKQQNYDEIKTRIKEIMGLTKVKNHPERYSKGIIQTSHIQYEIKILTKQFYKDINKKCPHCKKASQIVRKEGLSKFFLVDRSIKTSKQTEMKDEEEVKVDQQTAKSKKPRQQYMSPYEVQEHMKLLWNFDDDILKLLFGTFYVDEVTLKEKKKGYDLVRFKACNFFVEVLPITANRFRPENKLGDQTFLHGHTVSYTKILEINQELRNAIITMQGNTDTAKLAASESVATQELKEKGEKDIKRIITLEGVFSKWIELQDCVVGLFNSEKAQSKENRENNGVKQLLERKQGLFRMKMMGKRVNFACRSVISPDPLLNTNEVGVPLILARKLMIPENVNQHNFRQLGELVMNGPQKYPGAMYFEEGGHKTSLEFLSPQQRLGIVRELGSGYNKVVWRQLKTGDVMLFNRQPTLHKPSIMAHIARVLPNEQTIRFHYANCKSYNADFDGDEMNLHFLQSYVARAEAYSLALSDQQYISPTNGKPIRELIQDMIVSAVFLTMRDTFLTKQEFQQLLYVAVWNLFYEGEVYSQMQRIEYAPPAILKPKQLWTGKQLITSIMKIIVKRGGYDPDIGLNVEAKAQIGKNELPGCAADDIQVLVKDNELLLGILDKKQLGAGADYGLIHAFHELYGPSLTGQLLSGLARLFAAYLQMHGFTCGIDDLKVEKVFDEKRLDLIKENLQLGLKAATNYCGYTKLRLPKGIDLMNRPDYVLNQQGVYEGEEKEPNVHYLVASHRAYQFLEHKLLTDKTADEALDAEYKKAMSKKSSEIVQNTLLGLQKRFPQNMFSCMTISGAKGSNVNHSQVSVQLGQQELEGRRVPIMPSGRTLPSFIPYDPNPRAGGYIGDRFLTGLRPQEFFFHCMAGREGLIDTAVKTSRSGYLQRCLIKHLEGLVVQYDLSVRDNDGSMIQVFYGEDGIDTTKTKYLEKYGFLEQNAKGFNEKYRIKELLKKLDSTSVAQFVATRDNKNDTIMSNYSPSSYLGAQSEKSYESQTQYINECKSKKKQLVKLCQMRYLYSLAQPGEAVGCIAAQSVGEPSTQMTLNTFHLAGHGEKNVTLGIPRLREILMTATKKQKTPTMSLQFSDKDVTKMQAELYARRLSKLVLLELVKQIRVVEFKRLSDDGESLGSHLRGVIYEIQIVFEDFQAIEYSYGVDQARINQKVVKDFVPLLIKFIDSELKKDSSRMNEKQSYLLKRPQSEFAVKKRKNQDDDEGEEDLQDNVSIPSEDLNISDENKTVPSLKMSAHTARYLEDIVFGQQDAKITIKLPLNTKKILMTNIVKKTLVTTVVQEIRGIQRAKVLKNDKQNESPFYLFTEGVNLKAARSLDFIQTNQIESNDIGAILNTFGIEAARKSIINEILSVFNAYAVAVDYRHLYLIGDYMTFGGVIRAMNRIWIDYNTSPFLKMSFETSTQFLSNVCTQRQHDDLSSISSQLVVGKIPRVGTGLCDVFYSVPQEDLEEEDLEEAT